MLTDDQIKLLTKCKNDKEIKKAFKSIASKEPDNYFPTKELRNLGYMRKLSCPIERTPKCML